jgi:hypothetical protein
MLKILKAIILNYKIGANAYNLSFIIHIENKIDAQTRVFYGELYDSQIVG